MLPVAAAVSNDGAACCGCCVFEFKAGDLSRANGLVPVRCGAKVGVWVGGGDEKKREFCCSSCCWVCGGGEVKGEFEFANGGDEDANICVGGGLEILANGLVDCRVEGEDEMAELVDVPVGIVD